jgi:hypothetical protein
MSTEPEEVDLAAVTARQRAMWGLGDFDVLAMTVLEVSESLVRAVDPAPAREGALRRRATFAPNQEAAAGELLRARRPGGAIGLARWTPESHAGALFGAVWRVTPPPPGLPPATRWGTREGIEELLGPGAAEIRTEKRIFSQRYGSVDHATEVLRRDLGPAVQALAAAGPDGEAALADSLTRVMDAFDVSDDGTCRLECEYPRSSVTRASGPVG